MNIFDLIRLLKGNPVKTAGPIIAQYEPPEDLTAAETGLLLDSKIGRLEFLSAIYQLKTKRVIGIVKGSADDVELELLKYPSEKIESHEDLLLRFFFHESRKVRLADLLADTDFPILMAYFNYKIMQSLHQKGYLFIEEGYESQQYQDFLEKVASNPFKYIAMNLPAGIARSRTDKARQAMPHLLGFRQYIETAELDKIKFHAKGSLEEYIERLTPYAITFNQMERWRLVGIPLVFRTDPKLIKSDPQIQPTTGEYFNSFAETANRLDTYQIRYS
jgi:hypothetical protein